MCSRVSRLNYLLFLNIRKSSFKCTPQWVLENVFEGLDFLSHNYCEHNRHHYLKLPLDQ